MRILMKVKQKCPLLTYRRPFVGHSNSSINYVMDSGYFCPLFIILEVLNIKELQINEEIREREVRLIDVDGTQLGVVPLRKAMDIAMERKLDLVNIAPTAKPPVCKVLDYGKYKYELAKKEKEARKNQKTITVKEIRMTPNIDTHDLAVKSKRATEFLRDGDKVKVSVRFRGRELGHTDLGRVVLDQFVEMVSDYSTVEKKPVMEGRSMVMFLAPKVVKED